VLLIFPDIAVDASIHTSILVGLLVAWQLHERLGWAFAGFVVTGYLAALAMVSPPTLAVVLVESVLTFGAVRTLTDGLPALGAYAPVFGRERFLLYVLVSLPVRLLCSSFAMPRLAAWLVGHDLAALELEASLAGIGVVLVPLVANTFHKPGLRSGAVQVGVASALTWAVLALGVAPWTNFAMSGLSGSLDVLSTSATPPSRTLLLLFVTMFVAAHNNLRYGWDFGGILVPALLAVLALEPARLASTVLEVVWLYVAWRGLRAVPAIAALDVGGPRRIVSMYLVSWALHLGLAWVALWTDLPISVGDAFGFGYLLTSLVVTRCVAAGLARTLAPLVFTAVQGAVLSAVLAVVIAATGPTILHAADLRIADSPAGAVIALAEQAGADAGSGGAGLAWAASGDPAAGCVAVDGAHARVLRCREAGPVLVVARPGFDPDSAWLAAWLADRLSARAVVVAATDTTGHPAAAALRDGVDGALRQARAEGGPVIAVESGTAWTEVWTREGVPVDLLRALPAARLGVTEPAGPAWDALEPGEALLRLWPGDVDGPPPTANPDVARAARVVVAALARHGGSITDRPAALAWLAGLAGGVLDARAGVLTLTTARDTFEVRPGGAPWLIATTVADRHPGAAAVARWAGEALDASVVWIGDDRPDRRVPATQTSAARRASLGEPQLAATLPLAATAPERAASRGDGPDTLTVEVHADLGDRVASSGDWPDTRAVEAHASIGDRFASSGDRPDTLAVEEPAERSDRGRAAPREPDAAPTALQALARALLPAAAQRGVVQIGASPTDGGTARATIAGEAEPSLLRALLAPWPSAEVLPAAAAGQTPPIPELAFRQAALGGTTITLSLPRATLREADPAARAQVAAWASAVGLRPATDTLATPPAPESLPDRGPDPALQALADALTAPTLVAVAHHRTVTMLDVGPRRVIVAVGPDSTCRAVAGSGGAPAAPWSGCWSRP
jgi:hypothetical protein